LNQRARAAQEIGKLKRNTSMPIYEPDREKKIFDNVSAANHGPLPDLEVRHIYERIIDVMRKLQKEEIKPKVRAASGETEYDLEVND
jgi:chorismate mutase